MSTVPPVSRDAQSHHLALPKIWLSEGILVEVTDMEFSYYPQLIDLLYIIPVAMKYDIAAKHIHFLFAIFSAILIFLYIRRKLGTNWGLLGGLMFLSVPIIIKLSTTVYVDLGLLFFITAAIFSALLWLENTRSLKWLIVCAVTCGLALSTKYNAILSVTLLALLVFYFFLKKSKDIHQKQIKVVKYAAIFSVITLLIYSPWLIRNYSLTGNPVYPLFKSFFVENEIQSNQQKVEVSSKDPKPLTLRRLLYNESFPYILALPIRIFFEGEDDNPQFFDGKLNPFLLLFSLLLFIKKKQSWQSQFLFSFVVFSIAYTLLATNLRIRYIIPIVSPLIVLSVFGLYHLNQWLKNKQQTRKIHKFILPVLIMSFFIYNISYAVNLFKKIDPIPYISGKISREEYLKNRVPHYELNKLASELVSNQNTLLGIYLGNRRYYIDAPVVLQSELIFDMAKRSDNPGQLYKNLRDAQFSHILVRLDLFNKELYYKDEETKKIIENFFSQYANLIQTQEVFGLYEIRKRL